MINNAGKSPATPSHEVTEALSDSVVGHETDISKAESQEQIDSPGNALKRVGSPEEIISAAVFLAGPASGFANGAIMRVDGGLPVSV